MRLWTSVAISGEKELTVLLSVQTKLVGSRPEERLTALTAISVNIASWVTNAEINNNLQL